MEEIILQTKKEVFEQFTRKSMKLSGEMQTLIEAVKAVGADLFTKENLLEHPESLFEVVLLYQGYVLGRFFEVEEMESYLINNIDEAAGLVSEVFVEIAKEEV